jgi:glycosyltransferase involved in cell wall biosynthesis
MDNRQTNPTLTLYGRAFQRSGRGEDLRIGIRGMRAAGTPTKVSDAFGTASNDPQLLALYGVDLVKESSSDFNLFCINADEVERALSHLGKRVSKGAYNIILPYWELSKYPEQWLPELAKFDEVWAPSKFIHDSLAGKLTNRLTYLASSSDAIISQFLGRRYFGIPESSFVFLFFFDFTSFVERKNPLAACNAFQQLLKELPEADVRLVIKCNNKFRTSTDYLNFLAAVAPYRSHLILIDRSLNDNEMRNLLRNCDCFLSLHRSEGFGRGLGESMFLGKPVVATAYSGNMDFMNAENSCLVDYDLIPVKPESYPHWQDQVWADPKIETAVKHMVKLVSNPAYARDIGRRSSQHMRQHFSARAWGLRVRQRLEEIKNG